MLNRSEDTHLFGERVHRPKLVPSEMPMTGEEVDKELHRASRRDGVLGVVDDLKKRFEKFGLRV